MAEKTGNARPLTTPEVHDLLGEIAARHDVRYALVGEMSGGDGPGAWELRSASGGTPARAVLKFLPGRDAASDLEQRAAAMDVLLARGYPAPRTIAVGSTTAGTYLVQERLPGAPLGPAFTAEQLDEILRIHDLHADIGVELPGEPWPLPVTRPTLEGGEGFCLVDTMRTYSPECSDLLDELQDLTRANAASIVNTRDLVHFDFTYANILADDERISGVIDWEAVMLGDRGFDLAAFVLYVWDNEHARETLWSRALEISGVPALRTYFAHIIFRQVEWCTRFYPDAFVGHYLRIGRTILDRLAAH